MYVSSKVDFLCNIIVITGVMHAVRTQETSSACPADAFVAGGIRCRAARPRRAQLELQNHSLSHFCSLFLLLKKIVSVVFLLEHWSFAHQLSAYLRYHSPALSASPPSFN